MDADLSIFAILDKLKKESEESRKKGDLSNDDVKAINKSADAFKEVLSGGMLDKLDNHFKRLVHENKD